MTGRIGSILSKGCRLTDRTGLGGISMKTHPLFVWAMIILLSLAFCGKAPIRAQAEVLEIDSQFLTVIFEEDTQYDVPSPLLVIALFGLGAWNLISPQSAWWLAHGWWYKDGEPSDLALILYRLAGAFMILVGVVCIL